MKAFLRLMRLTVFASAALGTMTLSSLAETPDDQLIIGTTMTNILSLDPPFQTGREAQEVLSNVYDTLLRMSATERGKIEPGLASEWTVSEDGKTITLKLREGVKFHSGNPVTSADFLWSVKRALDIDSTQGTNWKIHGFTKDNVGDAITAPDDYTVVITLPKVTDPTLVLYLLCQNSAGMVVDRKLAEEHAAEAVQGTSWLTTHDAGSGPFTLQNWQPNNLIILERFDDYWGEPAKMRRVILRHMPESQTQRLALENGDIDIAMNLTVADMRGLEGNSDIEVQSSPGGNVYYLAVSMKQDKYTNPKVREALRYLIDYEGINNSIMPYFGTLHQRNIQAGLEATLPEPGYKLDVEKAKALLAEGGYPDGFDATLRVLSDPPFLDAATAIQATLAQGGIRAEIISGNGDAVYGKMRERDFDLLVGRGGGGSEPHPHSSLLSQVYNPDNSDAANLTSFLSWRTSFFNEDLNKMIDAALLEKDHDKQVSMYHDIQNYIDKDYPVSIQPFSQGVDSVALRKDVQDYRYHYAWTTKWSVVSKGR